ncbi:MAG: tetratricopeptide repeat protein [Deltaproteobacteria bacterium]|nr:tetratricopeptide repeat protein [Deltaproteobacteria bacterium]
MKNKGNFRYQLLVLILIPLGFFLYNDALRAPFVYDDRVYILQNEAIRSLSGFTDISGTRYLGFLSFALNYALSGFSPFDFHLVNILIHIANSALVFFLVASMASTPLMSGVDEGAQAREKVMAVAAVVSVLFLSHPLMTQSVTYVTQRFTSMATMFYLLAVLFYARARELAWRREKGGIIGLKAFWLLSLVFTIMAMKTKEISFTIPFAVLIFDLVFYRGHGDSRSALMRAPYYLTLLVIPLSIILPEYYASDPGSVKEVLRTLQVQEAASLPRDIYTFTQFNVIVTYIKLFLFPAGLAIDYGYPHSKSFFEPATVASFLFLASLFAFSVYLSSRALRRSGVYCRLFAFGVLWFFNALLVESFLVPIQDVIFDHRAYLPAVGFFIATASAVLYALELIGKKADLRLSSWASAALVLLLVCPPLFASTLSRNEVWTDEERLINGAIEKSPGKARLYYALAVLHLDKNDFEQVLTDATGALRLDPNLTDAFHVRGVALQRLGRNEEALLDFSRAIALSPDEGKRYYNRAVAYEASGDLSKAVDDYTKALIVEPGLVDAYNNRGVALSRLGEMDRAIEDIRTACSKGHEAGCENLARLEKRRQTP